MNVVGICHICSAPAMNTCSFCGMLVCRRCYDSTHGVCVMCKRKGGDEEKEFDEEF